MVQGSYGASNSEYRTQIRSHAKSQSDRHLWQWSASSRCGRNLDWSWSLERPRIHGSSRPRLPAPSFGNSIGLRTPKATILTITYSNLLPARIDYTGNDAAGITPYNSIRFVYDDRADHSVSYSLGAKVEMTKRVKRIQAWNWEEMVKEYVFDYKISTTTERSRLSAVQEIGLVRANPQTPGQREAFPQTTFKYKTEGTISTPWVLDGTYKLPIPFSDLASAELQDLGAVFADVNGDGRADLLYGRNLRGNRRRSAFLSSDAGWVATSAFTPPMDLVEVVDNQVKSTLNTVVTTGVSLDMGVRMVDVNGDGKVDLLYSRTGDKGCHWGFVEHWRLGQVAFQPPASSVMSGRSSLRQRRFGETTSVRKDQGVSFADLNGDGLVDLVSNKRGPAVGDCVVNKVSQHWQRLEGVDRLSAASLSRIDANVFLRSGHACSMSTEWFAGFMGTASDNRKTYLNTGSGWEDTFGLAVLRRWSLARDGSQRMG